MRAGASAAQRSSTGASIVPGQATMHWFLQTDYGGNRSGFQLQPQPQAPSQFEKPPDA
jgi:hypothetical protein